MAQKQRKKKRKSILGEILGYNWQHTGAFPSLSQRPCVSEESAPDYVSVKFSQGYVLHHVTPKTKKMPSQLCSLGGQRATGPNIIQGHFLGKPSPSPAELRGPQEQCPESLHYEHALPQQPVPETPLLQQQCSNTVVTV